MDWKSEPAVNRSHCTEASARFRWGRRVVVFLSLAGGVVSVISIAQGDFELAIGGLVLAGLVVLTDRAVLRCRSCGTPLFWAALKATSAFGMDHPLQHMNPCPKCGARQ